MPAIPNSALTEDQGLRLGGPWLGSRDQRVGSGAVADRRFERGQVAIEMVGTMWLILLAGLVAWELALVGWSAVGAANAARTAARAYSRTADAASATTLGHTALQNDYLDSSSTVAVSDKSVDGLSSAYAHVVVRVPMIVPGWDSPITIPASADIPKTG